MVKITDEKLFEVLKNNLDSIPVNSYVNEVVLEDENLEIILDYSFLWSSTDEGHDYWCFLCEREVTISNDHIEALRRICGCLTPPSIKKEDCM